MVFLNSIDFHPFSRKAVHNLPSMVCRHHAVIIYNIGDPGVVSISCLSGVPKRFLVKAKDVRRTMLIPLFQLLTVEF